MDDNTLSVDGKNIHIVSTRDPLQLPWKDMGIDIVIEGTGVFVDSKGAGKHLEVCCCSLAVAGICMLCAAQAVEAQVGTNDESVNCQMPRLISAMPLQEVMQVIYVFGLL